MDKGFYQGANQAFLAWEVIEQPAFAHARFAGDGFKRERGRTAPRHDANSGAQKLISRGRRRIIFHIFFVRFPIE
jgi:hypothetical protein